MHTMSSYCNKRFHRKNINSVLEEETKRKDKKYLLLSFIGLNLYTELLIVSFLLVRKCLFRMWSVHESEHDL